MAERLEAYYKDLNPEDYLFMNGERAEMYRKRVAAATDINKILNIGPLVALELLKAGKTLEAIQEFDKLKNLIQQNQIVLSPLRRSFLRWNMAVAYMRLGEQENCLAHHNTESCLLPISGQGVHSVQRGSREAIRILTEQLTEFPNDLAGRWLINIAYMTVGEWPDRVPPAWLIPPEVFKSEAEVKRFVDVAPRLGVDVDDVSGSVIVDDFDNDGNLDIMASAMSLHGQIRYFHNNGDGSFTDRTREAGLLGEVNALNVLQADYNNDGCLDALMLRGGWGGKGGRLPFSLLRNNCDGTFEDVTEQAGLLRSFPSQTAVWLDYNGDGWLDLFVGDESMNDVNRPCELHRNNGDGTFTDVAARSGVAVVGFIKAVISADFNNDGRPDLYLSSRPGPNILFRNDGPKGSDHSPKADWVFTDVSRQAGVSGPPDSFPAMALDYDNDGWPDIFVSGYRTNYLGDIAADYLGLPLDAARPRLYRNNHDGTFRDVTKEAHLYRVLLTMGSNFGDIDNDGWLDLYLGTGDPDLSTLVPNRMFRNAEGKLFQDVTTSAGVGHLQKGHGVSFADIDNDGDQDIYEVMGGAASGDNYRNVLYENPGYGNHWVTLKLEGVKSNRAAIGARIRVDVRTAQGPRSIYRTVGSGGSFGCSPLRQEIGFGQATGIDVVEILWPASGTKQILRGLRMDRFYHVREGDVAATLVALKTFRLSPGS